MNATWAFPLGWALVGLLAALVLKPSTACWVGGDKYVLADIVAPAATAAGFGLLAPRFTATLELVAVSVFVAVGVQLAVIDTRVQRLPRVLIWPTCVAVMCVLAAEAVSDGGKTADFSRAVAGSVVLAGVYLTIAVVSRGGIGAGDVRLAALIGCVLGWHSWPAIVDGTLLAFFTAGAVTVAFKRKRPPTIPFGPGMMIGAFFTLLM